MQSSCYTETDIDRSLRSFLEFEEVSIANVLTNDDQINDSVKQYKLSVNMFVPNLCTLLLNQHRFPAASNILYSDFYMNDLRSDINDLHEPKILHIELLENDPKNES